MPLRHFALVSLTLIPACDNRPPDAGAGSAAAPEHATGVVVTIPPSSTPPTTPLGAQTVGHVRVSVKKVSVGKVPLKQADGSVQYADEPRLLIAMRIENVSEKKRSEYNTWVPDLDAARTVAKLTDDQGREVKRVTFGFGNNVQGRTVLDTLTPGKVIGDLLVFEAPAANVRALKLVLPGANCGVTGAFEFEIDPVTITRPK